MFLLKSSAFHLVINSGCPMKKKNHLYIFGLQITLFQFNDRAVIRPWSLDSKSSLHSSCDASADTFDLPVSSSRTFCWSSLDTVPDQICHWEYIIEDDSFSITSLRGRRWNQSQTNPCGGGNKSFTKKERCLLKVKKKKAREQDRTGVCSLSDPLQLNLSFSLPLH